MLKLHTLETHAERVCHLWRGHLLARLDCIKLATQFFLKACGYLRRGILKNILRPPALTELFKAVAHFLANFGSRHKLPRLDVVNNIWPHGGFQTCGYLRRGVLNTRTHLHKPLLHPLFIFRADKAVLFRKLKTCLPIRGVIAKFLTRAR
jgi:hypothetical protein